LWWSSLTKDLQTEQLLCWSGMTDTEHSTSGSNEEAKHELVRILRNQIIKFIISLF